jgi:hypothetical protein
MPAKSQALAGSQDKTSVTITNLPIHQFFKVGSLAHPRGAKQKNIKT